MKVNGLGLISSRHLAPRTLVADIIMTLHNEQFFLGGLFSFVQFGFIFISVLTKDISTKQLYRNILISVCQFYIYEIIHNEQTTG